MLKVLSQPQMRYIQKVLLNRMERHQSTNILISFASFGAENGTFGQSTKAVLARRHVCKEARQVAVTGYGNLKANTRDYRC